MYIIKNDDAFKILPQITQKINLFILDLPYNTTSCDFDCEFDLTKMWECIKQIATPNAQIIMFNTMRFGIKLINSNPTWYRYDLIYEKSKKVGHLSTRYKPLVKHELIFIFSDRSNDDVECKRNNILRDYAKRVKAFINKPLKEIEGKLGNYGVTHFYGFNNKQFGIPTQKTYDFLTSNYNLKNMDGYKDYETIKKEWETGGDKFIYNPQMEVGKPYETKGGGTYTHANKKRIPSKNNGTRHPHSILRFNQPPKPKHPTEKPHDLLAWLIKTYSNKGDWVCDFTMGAGSCGMECIKNDRNFYGVELNKEYYDIAKERIESEKLKKDVEKCEEIDQLIAHNLSYNVSKEETLEELTEEEHSLYLYNDSITNTHVD